MASAGSTQISNSQTHMEQSQIKIVQGEPLNQPSSRPGSNIVMDKTLGSASNLVKLLPSGTVLVFQALAPSFTNHGSCHAANKYLTGVLIGLCTLSCLFFSFTDSFIGSDGKILFGVATFRGFYVFNRVSDHPDEERPPTEVLKTDLRKYRLRAVDFVHAFFSCFLFVAVTMSETQVQKCFVDGGEANTRELLVNLPLGIGVLVSIVFLIFPTSRKGIGYSDSTQRIR